MATNVFFSHVRKATRSHSDRVAYRVSYERIRAGEQSNRQIGFADIERTDVDDELLDVEDLADRQAKSVVGEALDVSSQVIESDLLDAFLRGTELLLRRWVVVVQQDACLRREEVSELLDGVLALVLQPRRRGLASRFEQCPIDRLVEISLLPDQADADQHLEYLLELLACLHLAIGDREEKVVGQLRHG